MAVSSNSGKNFNKSSSLSSGLQLPIDFLGERWSVTIKWFNDLKISSKLLISFISVCLVAGVAGLVGVTNIRKIGLADRYLYEGVTVPATRLGELDTNLHL